jgi:hypothetical protein
MLNIHGTAKDQGGSAPFKAARRRAVTGAAAVIVLLGLAAPTRASTAPQAYCMPELARLAAEWNAIGFEIPQKPSQQIVNSRSGLAASGPEVIFIREQIHQAFWDCRHGYARAGAACGRTAQRVAVNEAKRQSTREPPPVP